MAKQEGIVKLTGTIDDITFLKTKDGYQARKRGGVPAGKIHTDPAFQRTRENMEEFARAANAGKVLRTAVRTLMQNAQDGRVTSRLTTEMVKVIKADSTSTRGQRNVVDGEAELLEGFDFNINSKLSVVMFAPYTTAIDRVTGHLTVSIPSFVPAETIVPPDGASHFKIVSAGTEIDFENQVFTTDDQASAVLPWNSTAVAALNLNNAVTAASTHPLFLLLGIQFYQQVNGVYYSLRSGAFNPLNIVKVSGI